MPKYWFRQKTFGYGATPNTCQGWVLTFVACAALFGVVLAGPAIREPTPAAGIMTITFISTLNRQQGEVSIQAGREGVQRSTRKHTASNDQTPREFCR